LSMSLLALAELPFDVAVRRFIGGAEELEEIKAIADRLGRDKLGIAAVAHPFQRPLPGKAPQGGVISVGQEKIFPIRPASQAVDPEDRQISRMRPDPHRAPELAQILIAMRLDPGGALIAEIAEDLAGDGRISADEFDIDHANCGWRAPACTGCQATAR